MRFGFHAGSLIIDEDVEFIEFEAEIISKEYDEYLLSRGIPENIIRVGNSVDGNDLIYIPSITLLNAGALDGLVNGDNIVRERF